MVPGIDPKVDYAFKKVFGSETSVPILLHLVNAVLQPPPGEAIVSLEILNPFNDKEIADDKLSILDIKARDQRQRLLNIEMQMDADRVYPHRKLYYWAVLYARQIHEGDDYDQLRETISISFLDSVLFPQVPDYHLVFGPRCGKHPELVLSTHQSMHLVELPKFKLRADELATPLDLWCYFLRHGDELDVGRLPAAMQVAEVRRAMEELNMMTQNEVERERYEARVKYERDRRSSLKQALIEGFERGREEERKELLEKGKILERIYFCQAIQKMPLTPSAELLAMSIAELETLAKTLERR